MTSEPKLAVFDASAIVAVLEKREAAVRRLFPLLQAIHEGSRQGVLSFVNAAEIQYVCAALFERLGQNVFDYIREMRIAISGINKRQVLMAAEAKGKIPQLSLGDAFALALADQRGGRLFTSDPVFGHLWIRQRISVTLI